MTHHDDPDTTTPVDEVERLRGALDLSMRTLTETLHGILDVIAPDGDGYVMENGDIAWDAVWETLTAGYVHEADRRPNVPASPARVSTLAELDALPVGSVVLDPHRMAWQKRRPTSRHDGTAPRWYASGVREGFEGMAFPATVLHVPGRDLLAEARTTAVMDYMARKEIPRVELSNPERIRPFIAHEVAEAEARGYERGKRDALTEAAAAMGHDLLLFAALEALCESSTNPSPLADEVQDAAVAWLRARAAETPGGAA